MDFHEYICKIGTPVEVSRNQLLYRAGEIPDSCYLVLSGRVVSTEVTATGRELVYSTNDEGTIIFLPALLLHRRLTLSFKASIPSKLIRVQQETLFKAMSEDPEFFTSMFYDLAIKYADLLDSFHSTSHSMPWKVCNLLLTQADRHGVDYDSKVLIKKKYSQQMMADFLHANRITIARIIKELTDLALIERVNDFYCIRNIEKLQQYMDSR